MTDQTITPDAEALPPVACCASSSVNGACDANPAENEQQDCASCPHCGSLKDPWFSRVIPMGYHCQDCGKDVDGLPEDEDDGDPRTPSYGVAL